MNRIVRINRNSKINPETIVLANINIENTIDIIAKNRIAFTIGILISLFILMPESLHYNETYHEYYKQKYCYSDC